LFFNSSERIQYSGILIPEHSQLSVTVQVCKAVDQVSDLTEIILMQCGTVTGVIGHYFIVVLPGTDLGKGQDQKQKEGSWFQIAIVFSGVI